VRLLEHVSGAPTPGVLRSQTSGWEKAGEGNSFPEAPRDRAVRSRVSAPGPNEPEGQGTD